jgi:hypothetical protein
MKPVTVGILLLLTLGGFCLAQTSPPKAEKAKVWQAVTHREISVVPTNKIDRSRFRLPPSAPPHATLMCLLYGEAPQGAEAYNEGQRCPFTPGFRLDRKYHQGTVNCCGGGARSPLSPGDVPAGVHIEVDGGHYWALLPPVNLIAIAFDDNNVVTQWAVDVGHMYCGPAGGTGPGCNIKVYVYGVERVGP